MQDILKSAGDNLDWPNACPVPNCIVAALPIAKLGTVQRPMLRCLSMGALLPVLFSACFLGPGLRNSEPRPVAATYCWVLFFFIGEGWGGEGMNG